MTSWFNRSSPLRLSFSRRAASNSPPRDCDPYACFESFKRHWQQANEIIIRTQASMEGASQDDVLGVVNNLDQLLSLLVLELRGPATEEQHCLDHLLSENVLERLLIWSALTGRYQNVIRLEQLKLYETLLSNAPQRHLLSHEPFLRPLLSLMASCTDEVFPADIEKRLILLLNQLCVCLMQNPALLDLFFTNDKGPKRFVIFALLIPYIHREGSIGHQARDAMLLCMTLSAKNEPLGRYIAEDSNVCPALTAGSTFGPQSRMEFVVKKHADSTNVLATGLSGLYSRLPRRLAIEAEDWHCFTPDDVNDMPELAVFLNSLELCNAVVQVAHPLIRAQMLEFLYHGFLVPVMGPALLQTVAEELVASTAYLELVLRSVSEPGLLHTVLRFLVTDHYDGERVMDQMVHRINSNSRQLRLVSLALFSTLVGFQCEDVMLELVFRYLVPCTHVMLSQRKRINDLDLYCRSAEKFLSLAPSCCAWRPGPSDLVTPPRRRGGESLGTPSPARRVDSLQGNYCAYLLDAHRRVSACSAACATWSYPYDGETPGQLARPAGGEACSVDGNRNLTREELSLGESSGYESFACRESSLEPVASSLEEASLVATELPRTQTAAGSKAISREPSYSDMFHATPDIGPFLELLLRQLEQMLSNDLYLNLHLTGLISQLAAFPQPLLASFLLNHSLVFQPSVRSLLQVLGSLKQRLDSYLGKQEGVEELLAEAQAFLVAREERIVNARRLAQESTSSSPSLDSGLAAGPAGSRRGSTSSETFSRGEPKRRSFTSTLSSVFKRATQSAFLPVREHAIEYSTNGFRYTKRRSVDESEVRRAVLCALLLDEWLKELAALCHEQVACRTLQEVS